MVDVNRGEKLSINLDITYLQIPCISELFLHVPQQMFYILVLNLDSMDATGEEQIDVHHEIYKTPVDTNGVTLAPGVRHGEMVDCFN